MEQRLFNATLWNQPLVVKELLATHPNINVNFKDDKGWGALHIACHRGHRGVVALLLSHPNINVNLRNYTGETPFFVACDHNHPAIVRLLLADPRVDVNLPRSDGFTPLRQAAHWGHLEIVRWMLASRRSLNLGRSGDWPSDAIGAAIISWNHTLVVLLEEFKTEPQAVMRKIRDESGSLYAAEFSQVVFLCDDFFRLAAAGAAVDVPSVTTGKDAAAEEQASKNRRFFSVVSRLPLELQMPVCLEAFGINREGIPTPDIEQAIRALAKINY